MAEADSGGSGAGRKQDSHDFVYDLRLGGWGSEGFYADVAEFSAEVVAETESRASAAIDGYSRHVSEVLGEAPRSRGEYGLELLTVGMAIRLYEGVAFATPRWVIGMARGLYWLRRRSRRVKPVADFLRAGLFQVFLRKELRRARMRVAGRLARTCTDDEMERLCSLVEWLKGTGEFEQEWRRIENWQGSWRGLPREAAGLWIRTAVELFEWFTAEAENRLGQYTTGVIPFLDNAYARRFCREDQIFCGRLPVEYHLGMVAAEVMNEGLREEFHRRRRKVVLVPTCMRGARGNTCKAVVQGLDMKCAGCDPGCAVNRITKRMRREGIAVYMVPHSSGFSRWLERWQNDPDVGVGAVACMMNILAGGYEMRARGIASQCVPLDYPGCEKHWMAEPVPTSVDEERLVQIVKAGRV